MILYDACRSGPASSDDRALARRRALAAGIETEIGCHTFRATGMTAYLRNGGDSRSHSKWPRMNLRERRNFTIDVTTRSRLMRLNGSESEHHRPECQVSWPSYGGATDSHDPHALKLYVDGNSYKNPGRTGNFAAERPASGQQRPASEQQGPAKSATRVMLARLPRYSG